MHCSGMMNKITILSFKTMAACCVVGLCLTLAPLQAAAEKNNADSDEWVSLPESDRSSFAGIHGGTTPVSVMGSESEPAKETVSGRTGDDFVQVLQGETDAPAEAVQGEASTETAALVPFGLGETQTADAGASRLARVDQKSKPRGAVRLQVDDLKVLSTEDAPVSPESLLQAEELTRI